MMTASRVRWRLSSALLAPILGVTLGLAVVFAPATGAFVIALAATVLGLFALSRVLGAPDEAVVRRRTLSWTVGTFVFHVAAGLVVWNVASLTKYLGPDALSYQANATAILQHWTSGTLLPSSLAAGKNGFSYMLAGLYRIFGNHPDIGIVVNAAFGAALIPVLFDVTRRQFGTEAARAVPPLLILVPGFALWPSQLLREPGVYLLIAIAFDCAVRLSAKTSMTALLTMSGSLALLLTFRADVAFLVAAGLVTALMIGSRRAVKGFVTGGAMATLLIGLVITAGLGYGGYHLITSTTFQQVNAVHQGSAQTASGFGVSTDIASPVKSARYLPLGLTYFMLGPFPWQIHGLRQLPAVPDVLVWWFLLPSLWRGVRAAARRYGRGVVLNVLPPLVLAGLLALIFTNFGTIVRERMQVILLLVPLVSLGWSCRHERTRRSTRHGSQKAAV
jgi:hypothetical protein